MKHQAIDNKKSKNQGKEAVSQRKQVTLEGRESEEIYSTIVEKGNDGVVIIQDGILKFINTMMTRMTGYTKEEGIGKPFIDFISPPSKLLVYERYEKRLAGENVPNRYELEIISKNGTNIPVEINASIIDYEGKPADMAIIRDITERNRSEEALAKSADFSNRLISFMQDGFSVLDTKGVHLDVNPALCKMTGFSREELIGAGTPHPYWPPEEYEHIQAAFQMTLKSETNNFELKFMRKNGERFPVIVSPSTVKDRKGDIISYTATVKDITERKRTEKALEAALIKSEDEKNRTDAIISALGDGIIIQDTDYKIIYQNQIQKEIYGDHLGEFCYKVYENRDIICEDCPVEITFIDGKIHKSERAIPTDNGIKYFELTSSALREPSGRITAGVKVVRDITELKRMEGALRERERFLNGIFESIQDGIGVLDKGMTIIRVNPTVENWYPHIMPLAGKKCYEAYHGRKERCEICPAWKSIQTKKTAHEIVPRHGQDGKAVGWMEIYSYPMLDAKTGELTGVIEYVRDITERKLAEEKLKLLSEAMETALDGIQIVSLEGRIIYSNRAVEEIYGFSRNELTGKQVTVMKDDPDITEKLIIPSLKETGRWMGELLVKHKDGSVFPIWLSTSLVLNDKGEPIATVGIIKDMTERKETERKLKEAHSFLQSVINGVAEPIMVIDINYRVKLMNQAAGGGLSELPDNLCCYQISHHSDKPCINSEHPCPLEEVRRTGRPITVVHEHFKANGKKRFYEILASPFYDSDGAFAGIVESSRDITERKRAEEALRESEEKFRNIVEQSGDGIVLTDEEGTIIEWNGAEEKIIGLNRADVIGCLIWDVQFQSAVPEKKTGEVYEKLKASLQKLLTTGKSPMLNRLWENDIIRPDGSRRCVQVQVFLIKTERGFKAGSITRDITERKKAEEAIRKYASDLEESNKMKELFTDIMHHDLINPLNTVSGFIEILREEEDEPRKRIYLETIERNLAKGVELIESTTTLSRLESLQSIEFESIDIADVIRSNIENIRQEAEKAGIQIENRITQCMPVRANRIIEEVFSNLFSNAIKYASSGKKIIVDSKETDGFWRVNFVDFGAGIKDSEKTLIFERFRRLEKKGVKGSGLGLAIAKKIMELHNGRIWVEDNPEGGAIFVVEIRKNSSG